MNAVFSPPQQKTITRKPIVCGRLLIYRGAPWYAVAAFLFYCIDELNLPSNIYFALAIVH